MAIVHVCLDTLGQGLTWTERARKPSRIDGVVHVRSDLGSDSVPGSVEEPNRALAVNPQIDRPSEKEGGTRACSRAADARRRQAVPLKTRSPRLPEEGSSVDMNSLARDVTRTGAAKESHRACDIVRSAVPASKRVMNSVMSRLGETRLTCRLD
jgi:hypothetical protein